MAAGCYPQFYTFAIFDIYWHIEDTYVYPRINLHAYISKDAQDIGFQTLWPWHLFSRLSNIKGEGRVELTGSGFLFVPHSNYGSPMHPDLTIQLSKHVTLSIFFQGHPRSKVKVTLNSKGVVFYLSPIATMGRRRTVWPQIQIIQNGDRWQTDISTIAICDLYYVYCVYEYGRVKMVF